MAEQSKDGSGEAPAGREVIGRSPIFTPEVINDIHVKAELGRYRMRGFSMFKPIPHWDQLMFLPGTLTRFVIEGYREKCETKTVLGARFARDPIELDIPIYITGMSFGALSLEAKMALAKGASMAGTATCSGEGGMIPPERDLSIKWYYQNIQSRYGFNPHHLMVADACEFFIGQGCKVGLGGHLMGQKVTEQVAEMRSLPPGISLLQFSAISAVVPIATALAPSAKHLATSAPLRIPPATIRSMSSASPTSSSARRASGIAAISGMPVSSVAMCGPAPVPPSAPSR